MLTTHKPEHPSLVRALKGATSVLEAFVADAEREAAEPLIALIEHCGDSANVLLDWEGPITGSTADVERAFAAVDRMAEETTALMAALEQERARSAQLEAAALPPPAPARCVGSEIAEDERIRRIVREQLDAHMSATEPEPDASVAWWSWKHDERTWKKWEPVSRDQALGPAQTVQITPNGVILTVGSPTMDEVDALARRTRDGDFSDWVIR
jgi:hypothetical protein